MLHTTLRIGTLLLYSGLVLTYLIYCNARKERKKKKEEESMQSQHIIINHD